jgi:hypothetical protein
MKKLITLSFVLCALNASAKLGSPEKVKYSGDLEFANFCEAVVKDDVSMFKQSIRSKVGVVGLNNRSVLRKLTATNGMSCNGVDLKSFSEQREASKIFNYLSNAK